MPVKPFDRSQFQPIPDFEDISEPSSIISYDSSHRRRSLDMDYLSYRLVNDKKKLLFLIFIIIILVLLLIIFILYLFPFMFRENYFKKIETGYHNSTSTYLTSKNNHKDIKIFLTRQYEYPKTALKIMNLSNLQKELNYPLKSLAFGNIRCSSNLTDSSSLVYSSTSSISNNSTSFFSPYSMYSNSIYCEEIPSIAISTLKLNPEVKYQKILGFGGAFTESSAQNFFKLPKNIQEKVLNLYFSPSGLRFNLGRVPINSCDFSNSSYNFDPVANDYNLKNFDNNVTHDLYQLIPLIKLANETIVKGNEWELKLFSSPWSPPNWMKKSQNYGEPYANTMLSSVTNSSTCLIEKKENFNAWSSYFIKYLEAYQRQGINIFALTAQNEPEFAAPWEACWQTKEGQRYFIDHFLGPSLKKYNKKYKKDVLLFSFDHNKDHVFDWTQAMLYENTIEKEMNSKLENSSLDDDLHFSSKVSSTPAVDPSPYVDGIAFHWYGGLDRSTDGTYGYDKLNSSYHLIENIKDKNNNIKYLVNTEGCSCPNTKINNWLRAERLSHDILYDLQNYANGWIDWNLLLDYTGGFNHQNNLCDASLLANKQFTDVHIQPKYYYFGHFSKFLPLNSLRISSQIKGNFNYLPIDPIMQPKVEIGAYLCEKSTRQQWTLDNENDLLHLASVTQYDESLFINKTSSETDQARLIQLCLARNDGNSSRKKYVMLENCDKINYYPKDFNLSIYKKNKKNNENDFIPPLLQVTLLPSGHIVDYVSDLCLSLADNVYEPGALFQLEECQFSNDFFLSTRLAINSQRFSFNKLTGEIILPYKYDENLCLTAGWPFLNAVAFQTPSSTKSTSSTSNLYTSPPDSTVIIVSNEADAETILTISDPREDDNLLGLSIPARSLMTIIY